MGHLRIAFFALLVASLLALAGCIGGETVAPSNQDSLGGIAGSSSASPPDAPATPEDISGTSTSLPESDSPESDATDYSDPGNWICIPEASFDVDTFYLYPTVGTGGIDSPYCTIDEMDMRSGARYCLDDQTTAFREHTNVFAPYYRQIGGRALGGIDGVEFEHLAKGEPYDDVVSALDYYFENCNEGRPFILAGHSQGACLIKLALGDYFARHPDYLDRMIAAYALGWSITGQWLEEHPYIRFADGSDDTGVIVSWNTEGPDNKGRSNIVVLEGAISINPLNWRRDETPAPAEENRGTRLYDGLVGEYEVVPGLADATLDIERGVVVSHAGPQFLAPGSVFGPASYHMYEFDLFYESLRDNIATRISAFRR